MYAFNLAQRFSSFHATHHILSEPNVSLRASRLTRCALRLPALTQVLTLLGIEVTERSSDV